MARSFQLVVAAFAPTIAATTTMAMATACGRSGFERLDRRDASVDADDAAPVDTRDDAPIDARNCDSIGGLLGHWTLDAADLDGATVRDRSPAAKHGTLFGTPGPVVVAGQIGEAFDFAGTSQSYIALPDLPVDTGPDAFTTIALWFRTDDPNVDEVIAYMPPGTGPAPPRYDLWLTDRNNAPHLCINAGTGECWGYSSMDLVGRWVHVVAVFANGQQNGSYLFVDGSRVLMDCLFGACDESRIVQPPFELAASDATYAWHGLLDDVRMFDRALTDDEARAIYECR